MVAILRSRVQCKAIVTPAHRNDLVDCGEGDFSKAALVIGAKLIVIIQHQTHILRRQLPDHLLRSAQRMISIRFEASLPVLQ